MRQPLHASLIGLALITGLDTATAQSSQQERFNLNATKEQAVTQGLADQPARDVPGFSGQIGSRPPASEKAQQLPSQVKAQVPEANEMLFIKLPDRIVLIDPESQLVAEIIMSPVTTGSSSAPAQSPAR